MYMYLFMYDSDQVKGPENKNTITIFYSHFFDM